MKCFKLVILARQDLKMDKGKLAVQCSHAAVDSILKSDKKIIEEWRGQGGKKVVLKVKDKRELIHYKKEAESLGLKTTLITDAAKTFFKKPTTTTLGIGPDLEEKIDRVTGKLKIL